MNNILKFSEEDLGNRVQLYPDCITIMAVLSSGISSIIQIFWGDAVDFEVFRKWFKPIKGKIWVFGYKGFLRVD